MRDKRFYDSAEGHQPFPHHPFHHHHSDSCERLDLPLRALARPAILIEVLLRFRCRALLLPGSQLLAINRFAWWSFAASDLDVLARRVAALPGQYALSVGIWRQY